jgi:hypothetical protein
MRWFVPRFCDKENTLSYRTKLISFMRLYQVETTVWKHSMSTYMMIRELCSQIDMEKARNILARIWLEYGISEF